LDEVYCKNANEARLTTSLPLGQTAPLSPPASPAPAGALPPLNIPHPLFVPGQQHGANTTPSTAGSNGLPESVTWEATALPQQQTSQASAHGEPDKPKYPPFNPQDYIKLRKPWEGELQKQQQQYVNTGMEIKVRELEDASMFSRNPTPSVKARKFGRSVVNLLRTKSHFTDTRYEEP